MLKRTCDDDFEYRSKKIHVVGAQSAVPVESLPFDSPAPPAALAGRFAAKHNPNEARRRSSMIRGRDTRKNLLEGMDDGGFEADERAEQLGNLIRDALMRTLGRGASSRDRATVKDFVETSMQRGLFKTVATPAAPPAPNTVNPKNVETERALDVFSMVQHRLECEKEEWEQEKAKRTTEKDALLTQEFGEVTDCLSESQREFLSGAQQTEEQQQSSPAKEESVEHSAERLVFQMYEIERTLKRLQQLERDAAQHCDLMARTIGSEAFQGCANVDNAKTLIRGILRPSAV